VEGAGTSEVNGDYRFCDIKENAGYYSRNGVMNGKQSKFTIYKCSLQQGGFQWYLSITPDDMLPGLEFSIR
jgi:hypothetical protein